LTTARKDELDQTYTGSLMARTELPASDLEQSWLYSRFEQLQHVAASVPNDHSVQLRSSIMLANFGRHDEAIERLNRMLEQDPDDFEARAAVADVHLRRGNFDLATENFLSALTNARTAEERATINLKLGEIAIYRRDFETARMRLQTAQQENPALAAVIETLQKRSGAANSPP
jgi:thioredoxin-like negative regulator of GroEL